MTVHTISLPGLGPELRALSARTQAGVLAAVRATASVDAHRWIQWSIRGGGWGASEAPPPPPPPAPPRAKPPKGSGIGKALRVGAKGLLRGAARGALPASARAALDLASAIKAASAPVPPPKTFTPKAAKLERAGIPKPPPGYRPPVDTGDFLNSWRAEDTPNGAVFYSAASPSEKAGVIEAGRRPGKGIPIAPLADWVRRKFGISDADAARAIAIRISWSAKLRGRAGLHVLGRARPKIEDALRSRVAMAIKNASAQPPEAP